MLGVEYLGRARFNVKPPLQSGLKYPKHVKKMGSEPTFEGEEMLLTTVLGLLNQQKLIRG